MRTGEAPKTRWIVVAATIARALLAAGAASASLAALQLGDFTPIPSGWSLAIPAIAGLSIGLARMTVHETLGCVAFVLAASPALSTAIVASPTSVLERADVLRAALKAAFAADVLLLLPCLLGGIILGRWICGLSQYRARPATWKR